MKRSVAYIVLGVKISIEVDESNHAVHRSLAGFQLTGGTDKERRPALVVPGVDQVGVLPHTDLQQLLQHLKVEVPGGEVESRHVVPRQQRHVGSEPEQDLAGLGVSGLGRQVER